MLDRQLEIVREDLHREYDQVCPAADLDAIVDEVIAEHRASSHIPEFIPVLVERDVVAKLRERYGHDARPRKEVLFVSERNAGRSQMAAAVTKWMGGDNLFVRVTGLHPEAGVDEGVVAVLRDHGIPTDTLDQTPIVPRVTHPADVVVLLGVDDAPGVPGHRYGSWDVKDAHHADRAQVEDMLEDVITHVRELFEELGVEYRMPVRREPGLNRTAANA
ncbi:arsenate-mycothiol transferase ArsC [Corynebacterium sp. 335C]